MRLKLFAAALSLAALAGVTSAEARPYYGHSGYGRAYAHANWSRKGYVKRGYARRAYSGRGYRYAHARQAYTGRSYAYRNARRHYGSRTYASSGRSAGLGGRPRAWCGWWMRTQLGGGPEYNLAANWRRYGRSSGPQIGAVVVWPHHVGIITGRASNGRWIVKSGNDGGAVRERAQSVAGAVFRVG